MEHAPDVLEAVLKMTDAFHCADINAVVGSYEDAAVIAFEPGTPVDDREAIRTMFEQAFVASPRFTYDRHDILVSGDLALHLAPWTMSAVGPDGSPITERGLSVAVLRRQPEGGWKIVIDNPHGNRHLDPADP
jgi:ketosteroid isomerase-like protein